MVTANLMSWESSDIAKPGVKPVALHVTQYRDMRYVELGIKDGVIPLHDLRLEPAEARKLADELRKLADAVDAN